MRRSSLKRCKPLDFNNGTLVAKNMLTPASPSAPPEAVLMRLGNLFNAGHLAEVESEARLLVERYPNCVSAWQLLGASLHLQGKNGLPALSKALDLNPVSAAAHSNLGNVLKDLGRFEDAVASYRRAIKLKPDLAGIHHNLGLALMEIRKFSEAAASFRRALTLEPDNAETHNDLGNALKDLGQLDDAVTSYLRALKIYPSYAIAHNNLGNVMKDLGQLENALASYRRALAIKPDLAMAHNNLLFVLNYSDNYTPSYCLEKAREYGQMAASKVLERFSSWRCINHPERLRVGIVSGDLCHHPVGYFLENMLMHLDPGRIELIAYPTQFREDSLTARIKPRFAAWKPVAALSDQAVVRLIHEDGVHVLLDLSGHSQHNRLSIFAWKPAPVQATWLGYFATTGVAEMDYFLADRVSVPEAARGQFTESICYLPDTRLCFTPPQTDLPVAPLPASVNGCISFGCFQNLAKIGDNVLATWGKIFTKMPDAKLRMQCAQLGEQAQVQRLLERLQRYGINTARVTTHGLVPRETYLSAHAEVDIILDTFPFPGGTTTCEALWMGVPTLTLAGGSLVARQGASLLTAAGLEEWVASDEEEYIAKAVSFARDISGIANLRATLRQKILGSPLFDAAGFARNFEAALWEMWKKHQQKHLQD